MHLAVQYAGHTNKKGDFARGVLIAFKDCYNKARKAGSFVKETAMRLNHRIDAMDACCNVVELIWEKDELVDYVQKVVGCIKKIDTRLILTKRYLLNLDILEIVEQTKISRSQLYRQISKALIELEKELAESGITYKAFKLKNNYIANQVLRTMNEHSRKIADNSKDISIAASEVG